jgi:heat shock protein HslJ
MKYFIATIMVFAAGVVNTTYAGQPPAGKWRLDSYDFGSGSFKAPEAPAITFTVNRKGGVGGHTGCNVYGGDYTYEKGKFRVHDLIQTMMACEDPTPGFEGKYLDTLRSASEFKIRKSTLYVEDRKMKRKLRFIRVFERN